MKVETWDVLVVGAGPAGSSAALGAAEGGASVLMVERRPQIGIPVRCAEHIPRLLLKDLPSDRSFVVQEVQGMRTLLPGGTIKETRAPGLIIDRDRLDQILAGEARKAGALLRLSSRALGRDHEGAVLKSSDKGFYKVSAKVIIGADGPHSTVGQWAGLVNRDLMAGLQVRLCLREPQDFAEVHFDKSFFGGYGWLFPKGMEANVGIGMRKKGALLPQVLGRFIQKLQRQGKVLGGAPRGVQFGWIPVQHPREAWRDNILLVGDAAGQTHPITGAGVPQAVLCGRMAGSWAARAVRENDLGLLRGYEGEWRDVFEDSLSRAFMRRQELESQWERLPEVLPRCWVAFREYYGNP